MDSPSTSNTGNVRRSRRLAGLSPNQGQAGDTLEKGPHSLHDTEETEETVGGEDSESDPSSSDEGSTCQLPLRYRGSMPVLGESYCSCPRKSGDLDCMCGEEDTEYFEWHWDEESKSQASQISEDGKTARFHVDYSCGTAAVRGNKAMTADQHFWEVKMTTPVYGTDMMVGVGTSEVTLDLYRNMFCSFLGRDSESWGLSYNGLIHHSGEVRPYATLFGQGSIIGVHLDMWHGTLSFYKNRQPLGLAYHGLQGKTLYPIVCSTAARSGMKIIKACSFSTSLQFLCCQVLRSYIPNHLSVTDSVMLPPGLKSFLLNNLSWLLRPVKRPSMAMAAATTNKTKHTVGHGQPPAASLPAMSPILSRASYCRARFSEGDRKRRLEESDMTSNGAGPSGTEPHLKKASVTKEASGSANTVKRSSKCSQTPAGGVGTVGVLGSGDRALCTCAQKTNSDPDASEPDSGSASTQCTYSASGEISSRRPATSERNDSSDSQGSVECGATVSKVARSSSDRNVSSDSQGSVACGATMSKVARSSSGSTLDADVDLCRNEDTVVSGEHSSCNLPGALSQKRSRSTDIQDIEEQQHAKCHDDGNSEPVAKRQRMAS